MKIIKCAIFGLMLFPIVIKSDGCKGCSQRRNELSVNDLKQLRYGYLKTKILRKLHLTEPPKTNLPKPPLKSLLLIADMAENETTPDGTDDQLKTESIVIYPKEGIFTCFERLPFLCYRFDFVIPESLPLEQFASAEIWIHKLNSNESIRVYQVIINNLGNSRVRIELNNMTMEKQYEHWSKYEVLSYSFSLNTTDANMFIFEVADISKSNNSAIFNDVSRNEKPFLIIRRKIEEASSRDKRSLNCMESSTSCCKENFFLNFSEIGWDNWILHPDGYQANFCRGRCFNDLSNTRFYHSAVLLSYIRDNKDIAEEIGLNMCCTPSVMASVTIIYRNEEGLIYTKSIENMRVESCNCA